MCIVPSKASNGVTVGVAVGIGVGTGFGVKVAVGIGIGLAATTTSIIFSPVTSLTTTSGVGSGYGVNVARVVYVGYGVRVDTSVGSVQAKTNIKLAVSERIKVLIIKNDSILKIHMVGI